ncbi:hypothetical protein DQ353_17990 [Arthrobacter sp. AQ5-05]|uniref:hypothetical protein n=1 Tax=Arthrobacter sp. AQ5-05 TaxID=2184581 RepID=UPI000DCB8003|nr:hypothetical protein [Arthrobacter sp. AQ5-05]RAX47875.1 hypothetical protein DQ353_17990 [Arthrobacter sp. AQ5-05]
MKKILGSALAAVLIAGAVVVGGAVQPDGVSVQSIGISKTLGGNNNWPLVDVTLNDSTGTSSIAKNNNWPL